MLTHKDPGEAYRKVDFDARVAGAGPGELVLLCLEQFTAALGSALFAAERGDNRLKSQSLTRALSALTALELGITADQPLAPALGQVYVAARRALLGSVIRFDPPTMRTVRQDFSDIVEALRGA